ncbi:aromatic ring-hydroxylating dioxygenase subunit alpha [Pigmentiphaga soli]|uniref:Aromatic ring-hydroxylating dioxygenase subunit alpha n=1 Tax=Pigmentiphaga soli TaxID=1007095 RepID=A0ABP8HAI5_9BURK
MLTREENDYLARVGPGTPAGELLRRYWMPVSAACELTEEKPIKDVRILGEDLTLFRMPMEPGEKVPRYGLVGRHCPHRLAAFTYGHVDKEGIRCPYHGWKFSAAGRCLEQPAEPANSSYKDRIHHAAYPVRRLAGVLFAYMGPLPAPELPRWDVLAREDGRRWGVIESVIECNWLQAMENSVDPAHLYWLHGFLASPNMPVSTERFHALGVQPDYEEKHEFFRFDFGIQKLRTTQGAKPGDPPLLEQHPLVFPTSLRLVLGIDAVRAQGFAAAKEFTPEETSLGYLHNMQLRVPIDDTHTMQYQVSFMPSDTLTSSPDYDDVPFEYCPLKENGVVNMNIVTAQDALAWESQGGLTDRSLENLGVSDKGIVLLRKLIKEQIEIVRAGGDPIGVIRDPSKNRILDLDTFHEPFGLYRNEATDTETAEAS